MFCTAYFILGKVLVTVFYWSQCPFIDGHFRPTFRGLFGLIKLYTRFVVVSELAMTHLGHSKSLTLGLKTTETLLLNSQNVCDLISLHSDTNKSVFDWCKEGNAKKMDALLTRENINSKDEQVLGCWAYEGIFLKGLLVSFCFLCNFFFFSCICIPFQHSYIWALSFFFFWQGHSPPSQKSSACLLICICYS